MIKFRVEEKFGFKYGIVEMKGVGALANALRRVLHDEVETIRFNVDNANFHKTDPYLTYQTIIDLSLIHLYEEGEFYLEVANNTNAPYDVLSNHIKTIEHKPAKVEQDVFICTLQPRAKVKITKITSCRGIGRDHAKFCAAFGLIEWKPTDVMYVYYLNDRGFIENDLKCIKLTKDLNANKKYIIWSKIGEKHISEKDKKFSKDFIKLPAQTEIRRSEYDTSEDFEIRFRAHDPAQHFRAAIKVLEEGLDNENLTITIGDLLRAYIYKQLPVPIYVTTRMIDENYYHMIIDDQNADKLKANAISEIKKILKTAK